MALSAEDIIERRRLRRKLLFWRFLGVAAFLVAVVVAGVLMIGLGNDIARLDPAIRAAARDQLPVRSLWPVALSKK